MSDIFSTLSPFGFFVKCAVPNVISMAFISFYYIADGIFVGKYLGNDTLTALALIIPSVMISFALADMIAIGSAVQISMRLGLGKKHLARRIFSSSMLIIFPTSRLIGILEYLLNPILIDFLDANEDIKLMAKEYVFVFALFVPFTMCSFASNNYLRICGKTTYSMIVDVTIALNNIVLDYIFIVVLGWDLFSAALATCLGLMLGGTFGIFPFLFQNLELKFSSLYMNMKIFKNMVYNGSSEFFGNISGFLYDIFANLALLKISGTQATAAFSIVSYIDNFIITLITAMGGAMQPALGYNYAKKDPSRIKDILRAMFFAGAILSLLSVAMIFILGKDLVGLFTQENDQEFIIFTYMALMLFSFNYLFAWFNVLGGSFLTASNKASFSLILSLSQNPFTPLRFLLILPSIMGLKGVWLSPFFAGFCVLVLTCIFVRKIFKKLSFL